MFGIGWRRLLSCLNGSITGGMFSCSRAHFARVGGDRGWADPVQGAGGADDPAASGRVEDGGGGHRPLDVPGAEELLDRTGVVAGDEVAAGGRGAEGGPAGRFGDDRNPCRLLGSPLDDRLVERVAADDGGPEIRGSGRGREEMRRRLDGRERSGVEEVESGTPGPGQDRASVAETGAEMADRAAHPLDRTGPFGAGGGRGGVGDDAHGVMGV